VTAVTARFVCTDQIIQEARRRLSDGYWYYIAGGSESETTLRRNRAAFDRLALLPRVLVDVSSVDASTTFLGQKLRIPAILAPIGQLHLFDPDGTVASTRAATEFGIMHAVSSGSAIELEDVAAATPTPKIFQLNVYGDEGWTREIIGRVKAAGYVALALTVDQAVSPRSEREMVIGYVPPNPRPDRPPRERHWRAAMTWEKMAQIKELAGLPFMIKGIQTAADAKLAVEHGVDYVWVSNHGGRQLDHGRGTMDTLPEIVQAVDGRTRIIVDGGVQRGTDILKAVALGADLVALGKLQAWGLAAAGTSGVVQMLEILEDELVTALALCGLPSINLVTRDYVCPAEPVTMPHEMSSWVNMPVDRIR
jgi:isopentenyl diphosphate isomerase/L-lactate dehydrogenase-like FMN-dependent dehydrogenase